MQVYEYINYVRINISRYAFILSSLVNEGLAGYKIL